MPTTWPRARREDLLGALLSVWQFGAERQPGTTRLRVISPSLAEHGWASRHTVIEVINDDMPFLVDSTTMEINRQGLSLHLIVHPVLVVQRDAQGRLQALHELRAHEADPQARRESWMHVEVDRLVDPQLRAELAAGLERVLADVRSAVRDWRPMLERLHEAIAELQPPPPTVPAPLADETRAFLQWLADDHFTLLGYRRHDLANEQGEELLRLVQRQRPGRAAPSPDDGAHAVSASFAAVPAQARAMARAPVPLLLVTRSNTRSTVHRPGYSDYVGIKRYNAGRRGGRRAPLRRPVQLHRLRRARRARSRCCARRWRPCCSARRCPTAATWPRRWSTSWPATRATTCSRSARTSCTTPPWASWRRASASGCACSCGATPTSASFPAWCTCRARPIRPSCARSSRPS